MHHQHFGPAFDRTYTIAHQLLESNQIYDQILILIDPDKTPPNYSEPRSPQSLPRKNIISNLLIILPRSIAGKYR